jgi:hypothetical protein
MRDTTYDDACARPDTGTAETRHAVANHGRSDHMPASETLRGVADPTPISDRGFTTSAFDMEPRGAARIDLVEHHRADGRTVVAWDDDGIASACGFTAPDAVATVHGAVGAERRCVDGAEQQGDEGGSEHVGTMRPTHTAAKRETST